jgi:hypothetical protein
MRSYEEIKFRLRQEMMNAVMWLRPPTPHLLPPQSWTNPLPDPAVAAGRLQDTAYAAEVERLANQVCEHRFPLLGLEIVTGPDIRWRRDYVNGVEMLPLYFRRIPYLDRERAGDHKIIWELNRHQHLVLLAQASALTGRKDFIGVIERHLSGWFEQNPFQCGINWASALEVAFRALSWMWLLHIAGSQLTSALRERVLLELYRHGLHLEYNLSIYFSRNTHLLGEAVALHALGRMFPQFKRSAAWEKIGRETVRRELDYQVFADGAHFENSSYYHVYALDLFLLHYILAGRPAAYQPVLARMAEYLDTLLGPPREIPLIGDDDGGRLFHPYGCHAQYGRATIATASVLLGRRDWYFTLEDLHPQCAWWVADTDIAGLQPQAAKSRFFPSCGIAAGAADGIQLLVDAGTFGAGRGGHSHSDTLQIIVRQGREDVLIDPGTYTYVGDPEWRNHFRGSAAHNTVRIDGRDQASPGGPFGWRGKPDVRVLDWGSSPAADSIDAECGYDSFHHRRRVLFLKPGLIFVLDTISAEDQQPHTIEQFWHPGSHCTQVNTGAFAITEAILTVDPRYPAAMESGWRSRAFGTKEPAVVIRVVAVNAVLPVQMAAVLDLSGVSRVAMAVESGAGATIIRRGGQSVTFPDRGRACAQGQLPFP